MRVANGRRRLVVLTIYAVVGLVAQGFLGLAVNQASSDDRWPWLLDVVRQYPWWSSAALTVLLAVLAVGTFRLQSDQDSTGPGPVPPRKPERQGPLQVLYKTIPPVTPDWERQLNVTSDSAASEHGIHIHCDPADARIEHREDVDAYVILFSATHRTAAIPEVRNAARQCRENSPAARLLIAGCDDPGDPMTRDDLCTTVGTWRLGGSWDANVFVRREEFDGWFAEHLTITIGQARRHGRWHPEPRH